MPRTAGRLLTMDSLCESGRRYAVASNPLQWTAMTSRKTVAPLAPRASVKSRSNAVAKEFCNACGLVGAFRIRIRCADRQEKDLTLDRPFALIGRGSSCEVTLPSLAPRQACLQFLEGRLYCTDLGSRTGLRINGVAKPAGWLEPDDELQIGPYTIALKPDGAAPRRPSYDSEAHLAGPNALEVRGTQWSVPDGVTTVGRASTCTLRSADPGLDRYHSAVIRAAGQIWLADLRSGKGTRVNGKVVRLARLRDGDLVQAGSWAGLACVRSADPPQALATIAEIPGSAALPIPYVQMMEQFQQCIMMMGQMFTSMHQEHMAMVREQVAQLQDVARELATRQSAVNDIPWAAEVSPPSSSRPAPMISRNGDSGMLQDAHSWFTERMANLVSKSRR